MKSKKIRINKKFTVIFFLILLVIGTGLGGYHLRNKNIENKRNQLTLSKNENAIVLFYKDDCPDCQSIFDEVMVKKDFSGTNIKLVNLNNIKNKYYIGKYNLKYVPTFIILRNGQEINRYTGVDKNKINLFFKEY